MSGGTTSSSLLLDELLDAGDVRVLPELLGSRAQKKLAGVAQKLLTDPRPFAREVLRGYIDDGCDRPGHRVFVKTVFKAAERGQLPEEGNSPLGKLANSGWTSSGMCLNPSFR